MTLAHDFDGEAKLIDMPVFDGLGGLSAVTYNSGLSQPQSRVLIFEDTEAELPQYLDNRGHRMFSIELIQTSDFGDNLAIAYDLASNPGIVTVAGKPFWLSIDLNDGRDKCVIRDALPLWDDFSTTWGALVSGGDGHDQITGGKLDDQLAGDGGNDLLKGGKGNDVLSGGNGDDLIWGGVGNDTITADSFTDGGSDIIYGGAGRDSITLDDDGVFDKVAILSLSDSPDKNRADAIFKFEGGIDVIDLSEVDANALTAGDQAFVLRDRFTGKAGQLRYQENVQDLGGGVLFVTWEFAGDVNGDKRPDLFFRVFNPTIEAGPDVTGWFAL